MKSGHIKVPEFPSNVYKTVQKSGSRTEYSLNLNEELRQIGSKFTQLPLKYASVVHAFPGSEDQSFHSDSISGERVLIYLTDVTSESNGPIEFKDSGKILGPAGTYIHYNADTIHRGCKSDIDRYALAMAFDNSSNEIVTVGAGCSEWKCPIFYRRKTSPEGGGSNADCCEFDFFALFVALLLLGIIAYYAMKK